MSQEVTPASSTKHIWEIESFLKCPMIGACLSVEEHRRVLDKAREILECNMAEPPDLETLAGEVGMGLSKFKEVFPRVCGMLPYAYLRQTRMERARHLLAGRRLSVTEAAMEVGQALCKRQKSGCWTNCKTPIASWRSHGSFRRKPT